MELHEQIVIETCKSSLARVKTVRIHLLNHFHVHSLVLFTSHNKETEVNAL